MSNLFPTWTIGSIELTDYPYSVDRDSTVDIGEPEMVVVGIPSQVADGDLERTVRHGNRTYVLVVYIEGPTLLDLAESEALLRAELRKSGLLLTHDPGDGFAPASVYEVQTARLTPERRDPLESHLMRKVTLTLTCSSWARSTTAVTVQSLPAGTTTALVDNCNSNTGWSATRSGASWALWTFDPDRVGVAELDSLITSPEPWTLTRTGSVNFSATPYLVAEMKTVSMSFSAQAFAGSTLLPVMDIRAVDDGFYRVTFDASGVGTVGSLTFSYTSSPGEAWQGIFVRNIDRTDIPPGVNSRQLARIIDVKGTERTPASIAVAPSGSETSLGFTVVHTSPETGLGYSPALRQYRASGNTQTTDATLVSGKREPVNGTPVVAQVPLSSMPEGQYSLAALMRSSVVGTFKMNWVASTLLPGIGYLGTVGDVFSATFETANVWTLIPIETMTLPPVRSNGAFVQLNLNRAPVAAEVIDLDEWWALREADDCATTIMYGSGAFLWLDSPDVNNSEPRVWTGGNGNRSDAHHPSSALFAQGSHTLHPGGTSIFVATSGLVNAKVSATYYPRFHSNVADTP